MAQTTCSLIDHENPVQALGQYRSWALEGQKTAPIDMIWTSIASLKNPLAHRVLPHGEPSIAILRKHDLSGAITNISMVICGPRIDAHLYQPEPLEELIAVRVRPEISATVFAIDPAEFATTRSTRPRPAPKQIRDACSLALQAAETCPADVVAGILATAILRSFEAPQNTHAPEAYGATLMRASHGGLSAGAIAHELGISERHFRRRFRDHLGIPPKTYARQLRLTHAATRAEENDRPDWAQIAQIAGFHDQSHMIKDYRAMIGLSPKALHRERRQLSGFYNQ